MKNNNNIFKEGQNAYWDGWDLIEENPYKKGTSEYKNWRDGWNMECDKNNDFGEDD